MQSDWASDNLQVIRTLMERAALYRRALAPLMLCIGGLGLAGGFVGVLFKLEKPLQFFSLWMTVAVVALASAFLVARRQAWQASEVFWTAPARRVARGVLMPLLAGLMLTLGPMRFWHSNTMLVTWVLPIWMLCYACALHAAGAFMPRGIRLLAWCFVAFAAILTGYLTIRGLQEISVFAAHVIMGTVFGAVQLIHGLYLKFTGKSGDAS